MNIRSAFAALVLAPLLGSGHAFALSAQDIFTTDETAMAAPGEPETGRDAGSGEYRVAQAADPRITQLEEQVRQLNGLVEELNFQILQMQEQLRRMQEDNEFRFQQLEERSDAGGTRDTNTARVTDEPSGNATQEPAPGTPPRDFGSITFDENGNVKQSSEEPMDLLPPETAAPEQQQPPADDTVVAALPQSDGPGELYQNSYEFILSGDYQTAEAGFRRYIEQYPDAEQTPDAHFWLGEALLGQEKYRDAAQVFLTASRDYPDAGKAPETLFKLGVSLTALDQRDVACATFEEVQSRYPDASPALLDRVEKERTRVSC